MKAILLLILGIIFTSVGLVFEEIFVSIPSLIAATMVLAEIINNKFDLHDLWARLVACGVGAGLGLIGYLFQAGHFAGMDIETLIVTLLQIVIFAYGAWNGLNVKKFVSPK